MTFFQGTWRIVTVCSFELSAGISTRSSREEGSQLLILMVSNVMGLLLLVSLI
jgi:hypothetical protein